MSERLAGWVDQLGAIGGRPSGGVTRVSWSTELAAANQWLVEHARDLGLEAEVDPAGNVVCRWVGTAPGEPAVVVGSHLDTVPDGGRYDGAFGVLSGLEALARLRERGFTPRRPVWLVAFNDEEGTRFDASMFGSHAFVGDDVTHFLDRVDATGVRLDEAMRAAGADPAALPEAARIGQVGHYLELHIEQGPRLEEMGRPAAAVIGCFGVERHAITFTGKASHAGSTPMELRRDAFLAAGRFGLACRDSAVKREGVATIGTVKASPGIPTIINQECEVTLDQRAFTPRQLRDMLSDARRASEEIAREEGVEVAWRRIWQIDPVPFDERLVELAAQAVSEVTGEDAPRLPSGALHDCAEVARRAPAVMIFSSSTDGVSHNPAEDTPEDDLRVALRAYGRLYELTAGMISAP
jgi:N-carbamoyl-L-amino-acid hydrolase